ncbi:MAG: hypothetical protein FWF88_05620 [Peptococcaceae bacterium]|nr:hypothetical protein [Peptococcaceae bacterium]
MLNSVTRKLVNNIQEKLDSLYTFESSTRGLYGTPQSILPDIRTGIAAIEASVYNPVNHTFSFPPGVSPDMSWRETLNAKWDEKMAEGMKILTFEGGQAYAKGLSDYTSYSTDPVNLSTGNFIYQKVDMILYGTSIWGRPRPRISAKSTKTNEHGSNEQAS